VFRIEEIAEHPGMMPLSEGGLWKPPINPGWNYSLLSGVSNMFGLCNGHQINWITQPPRGIQEYKKYSMYYAEGLGFWVLRGDARSPQNGDVWHRLCFDNYDVNRGTSYLTNAGQHSTLRVQPPPYQQAWADMLLPDIYHSRNPAAPHCPGGLVGELPIFLGLMAFTVTRDNLAAVLPRTFTGGRWNVHAWQEACMWRALM
jgi:hypothetical protein